jgi:hypothetical protein
VFPGVIRVLDTILDLDVGEARKRMIKERGNIDNY